MLNSWHSGCVCVLHSPLSPAAAAELAQCVPGELCQAAAVCALPSPPQLHVPRIQFDISQCLRIRVNETFIWTFLWAFWICVTALRYKVWTNIHSLS